MICKCCGKNKAWAGHICASCFSEVIRVWNEGGTLEAAEAVVMKKWKVIRREARRETEV